MQQKIQISSSFWVFLIISVIDFSQLSAKTTLDCHNSFFRLSKSRKEKQNSKHFPYKQVKTNEDKISLKKEPNYKFEFEKWNTTDRDEDLLSVFRREYFFQWKKWQ